MKNETRCRACGRVLKNQKAVAAGIGPACARKEREGEAKGRRFKGAAWDQQGLFDQVEVQP
jgi:hypothetical protein